MVWLLNDPPLRNSEDEVVLVGEGETVEVALVGDEVLDVLDVLEVCDELVEVVLVGDEITGVGSS